jgi:hypothetical protein
MTAIRNSIKQRQKLLRQTKAPPQKPLTRAEIEQIVEVALARRLRTLVVSIPQARRGCCG